MQMSRAFATGELRSFQVPLPIAVLGLQVQLPRVLSGSNVKRVKQEVAEQVAALLRSMRAGTEIKHLRALMRPVD